jgi:hypothetical protein
MVDFKVHHIEEGWFPFQVADGGPDFTATVIVGRFSDQARIKKDLAGSLKRNAMLLNVPDILAFIPEKSHPLEYIGPIQRPPLAHTKYMPRIH